MKRRNVRKIKERKVIFKHYFPCDRDSLAMRADTIYFPRYEISSLWPDQFADARDFLRRDALPAQMAGRAAAGHPARESGKSGGMHPPCAGTGHQPRRNRARLRHVGNAARRSAAEIAARQNDRAN